MLQNPARNDFKLKSSKRSVAGAENDDSGFAGFSGWRNVSTFYSERQPGCWAEFKGTESLRACVCPQKPVLMREEHSPGAGFMELEIVPSPSVENRMGPEMNRLFQ